MLAAYRSGQGFTAPMSTNPSARTIRCSPPACRRPAWSAIPATPLGKGSDDPDAPPIWDAAQGSCEATYPTSQASQPEHLRVAATLAHAGYLVLRLRSYPAWRVRVNGGPSAALPLREDGLLAVPVPQGPVNMSVDWTTTPDIILAAG